jgi:hypothetical protein
VLDWVTMTWSMPYVTIRRHREWMLSLPGESLASRTHFTMVYLSDFTADTKRYCTFMNEQYDRDLKTWLTSL